VTEPLRDQAETDASRPRDASEDETVYSDPDAPGPGLAPPTATESLVNALLEAGPEVAEHVVRAAQELLLAAQTIVDAADKAIQEQQAVRDDRREQDAAASDDAAGAVRHLDLAE
jgi:hypothetical protein